MRVTSANVNGVRAAARRGGLAWLVALQPDVVTLQEVRAGDDLLRELVAEAFPGWYVAHDECAVAGRSGTAVLTRSQPLAVRHGLGRRELVGSGRWVEADVATPTGVLTVVSAYVPTGEAGTERQAAKQRSLDAMSRRLAGLRR